MFIPFRTSFTRILLALVAVSCFLAAPAFCHAKPLPVYGRGVDVYTTASGMAVADHVLYLTWPLGSSAARRMVVSVDITHPDKPVLLDTLEFDGCPQGLAIAGSHLLMVNGLDIWVIDASDPADLKVVGGLRMTDSPIDGPCAIQVRDHTAFVACRRAGVAAVDISNIHQPRVIARLPLPGVARDVTLAGNNLLDVASDTYGVHVVKINLADKPSSDVKPLELLTRLKATKGSPGRIVLDGPIAYVAAGSILLGNISLADPQKPQWMAVTSDRGMHSPFYGSYAHDLAIVHESGKDSEARTFALIADGEAGLMVVDVTDPQSLTYLPSPARHNLSSQTLLAVGVKVIGHHAYVLDQNHGLRVYDITSPADPEPAGKGLDLTRLPKPASKS
jgi:hypothetical protein